MGCGGLLGRLLGYLEFWKMFQRVQGPSVVNNDPLRLSRGGVSGGLGSTVSSQAKNP